MARAQAGELDAAAALCEDVLRADPKRLEAHYLLGLAAAQRGAPADAAAHLERYLEVHNEDVSAWFNLGVVRQQANDPDGAARAYRRVLRRAPDTLEARVNLAMVERARGRPDVSLELLTAANVPNDLGVAVLQGECLADLRRFDEANALLEAWTRRVPADDRPALALARSAVASGRTGSAISALESTMGPNSSPAREDAISVLLAQAGRIMEAIERSRAAVAKGSEQPAYWFNLAAVLSKRTDAAELREALEAADRCLSLSPEHAAAWHCRGLVCAKLDRPEDAEQALSRAATLAPGRARFAVDFGDFLVRSGELDRGLAVLGRAATGDRSGEASRQLGVALLLRPEPAQALQALDDAEARAPTDQRVIAHRGLALQQLGRHDEAERYLGLDRHVRRIHFEPPSGFETIEDLNRALAHDIRTHSRLRFEPIGLAARNGSLTEELLADRTPAILGFEQRLREAIEALRTSVQPSAGDPFLRSIPGSNYELNIWATCVQSGGHIDTHIHEESWLSGAYYVALPPDLGGDELDPAGWFEFGRPHAELPPADGARIDLVRPEEGLLILFPSYLFHRTLAHASDADRISISFDLVPRS